MEEFWKDITTLSSSAYHSHHPTTEVAHHQSVHDFLASPTQKCDPNPKYVSDHIRPKPVYSGSFASHHSSPTLSSVFASSVFPPKCSEKRASEGDNGCGDRKYKRKMKNRESAIRSRARRQAYTNELELELAHLREENAMLRRRQEDMSSAAAASATVAKYQKREHSLEALQPHFEKAYHF